MASLELVDQRRHGVHEHARVVGGGARLGPLRVREATCRFQIHNYSKGVRNDPNECYTTREQASS